MLELHALSMSHSSSYFLVLSLLTYFLTHRSVLCSMLYRLHCRRLASRFFLLVFSRCADVLSCMRLLHHYRKAFWTESGCIKLFERIPFYPISIRLYLIHFLKNALFSLEALIASLAFQQQHALAGFPLRCSIKQQAICKFRWLEVSIIKIQPHLYPMKALLSCPGILKPCPGFLKPFQVKCEIETRQVRYHFEWLQLSAAVCSITFQIWRVTVGCRFALAATWKFSRAWFLLGVCAAVR